MTIDESSLSIDGMGTFDIRPYHTDILLLLLESHHPLLFLVSRLSRSSGNGTRSLEPSHILRKTTSHHPLFSSSFLWVGHGFTPTKRVNVLTRPRHIKGVKIRTSFLSLFIFTFYGVWVGRLKNVSGIFVGWSVGRLI